MSLMINTVTTNQFSGGGNFGLQRLTSVTLIRLIQTLANTILFTLPFASADVPFNQKEPKLNPTPNCITSNCPDLAEDQIHFREKQAIAAINGKKTSFFSYAPKFQQSQEYLRHRLDDPREKLLYLVGESSHNDALNPALNPGILSSLVDEYDLKYKVVDSLETMCKEIEASAETGDLTHVVISAHGNSYSINLSNRNDKGFIYIYQDFKQCFKPLAPEGRIVLDTCEAGAPDEIGNQFNNFAQKLASSANRLVQAATIRYPTKALLIDSLHPLQMAISPGMLSFSANRPFRNFYPGCDTLTSISSNPNCFCPICPELDWKKVQDIEKIAAGTIVHNESIQGLRMSLEAEQVQYFDDLFKSDPAKYKEAQEYLRLRLDDPREKLLYLRAADDSNGALNPLNNPVLLKTLSERYDLKYKVIGSYDQICKEIEDAAKIGKLANVIIHAHGEPDAVHLEKNERIDRHKDLATCFSGIPPTGKITLFSCSAGEPKENDTYNNIAQYLADKTKRTVIASTESTSSSSRKIVSMDPLVSSHPSADNPNLNIYRIFEPRYQCPNVEWKNLSDREKLAHDAINENMKANSITPFLPQWDIAQNYFRVCKENPKPGFIYFSAHHDENGALDPKLSAGFLRTLSDKYDLMYRSIKTYDEMCSIIDKAGQTKELVGVAIQAPFKKSSDGLLLHQEDLVVPDPDPTIEKVSQIHRDHLITAKNGITKDSGFAATRVGRQYFIEPINNRYPSLKSASSCFSRLLSSGRIVLLSSQTGVPQDIDSLNSIAQKLATHAQRVVVAPTGDSCPVCRTISSLDPFMVFHPQKEDPTKNLYRTFYPSKP